MYSIFSLFVSLFIFELENSEKMYYNLYFIIYILQKKELFTLTITDFFM